MATTATPAVESVRIEIEKEVKARYDAKFVKEIEEFKLKLQAENDTALKAVVDDFRKQQTPPTVEEIRTLLSQEYLTFDVEVPWESETSTEKVRTLTIRELPSSVEKKFYNNFKDKLIPHASDLAALAYDAAEGDMGEKIKKLLESLDPAFDLFADTVVMILNPRGKEKDVTREWVQENLSVYRQWNIIVAQAQVNRLRDFFSQLSRSSKGMTTGLGVGTRR